MDFYKYIDNRAKMLKMAVMDLESLIKSTGDLDRVILQLDCWRKERTISEPVYWQLREFFAEIYDEVMSSKRRHTYYASALTAVLRNKK